MLTKVTTVHIYGLAGSHLLKAKQCNQPLLIGDLCSDLCSDPTSTTFHCLALDQNYYQRKAEHMINTTLQILFTSYIVQSGDQICEFTKHLQAVGVQQLEL